MTLTAAALLDSRKIVLHITGSKKWQIYREAVSGESAGEYPVSVFLHQGRVPVCVYWNP
jgi:6-phosphogluconolactonase